METRLWYRHAHWLTAEDMQQIWEEKAHKSKIHESYCRHSPLREIFLWVEEVLSTALYAFTCEELVWEWDFIILAELLKSGGVVILKFMSKAVMQQYSIAAMQQCSNATVWNRKNMSVFRPVSGYGPAWLAGIDWLETPSQKPSILYRNQTKNEPFSANFREDPFGELVAWIWEIKKKGCKRDSYFKILSFSWMEN